MPGLYHLSVDVGASRISAATARLAREGAITADAVPLGRRNDQVPAVAFIESDGNVLVGDEAQLLGHSAPERLIREFTRSIGDDVPLSVGGLTITAEHVFATSVAAVVDAVSEREGERPAAVVVTYPTNWGPHRLGLIRSALTGVGLSEAALVPGVVAAALDHDSVHPLEPGQTMAVHDMGGTSYHAAVLRKDEDGSLQVLGQPRDIDDLGGLDFDDAVLRHVLKAAGVSASAVGDGPEAQAALRQLRGECVDAKESLSFDAQATIPVLLPGHSTAVRLTRSEFESMTGNLVDRTIDSLDAALESARVEPEQLATILLVGGTSRIPRVAQRLSETFNRPIAMPEDPAGHRHRGCPRIPRDGTQAIGPCGGRPDTYGGGGRPRGPARSRRRSAAAGLVALDPGPVVGDAELRRSRRDGPADQLAHGRVRLPGERGAGRSPGQPVALTHTLGFGLGGTRRSRVRACGRPRRLGPGAGRRGAGRAGTGGDGRAAQDELPRPDASPGEPVRPDPAEESRDQHARRLYARHVPAAVVDAHPPRLTAAAQHQRAEPHYAVAHVEPHDTWPDDARSHHPSPGSHHPGSHHPRTRPHHSGPGSHHPGSHHPGTGPHHPSTGPHHPSTRPDDT